MKKPKTIQEAIDIYHLDDFINNEEKITNSNEKKLFHIFEYFNNLIKNEKYTIDKTGVKTVELLGWQCRNLNPWQPLLDFGNNHKSAKNYIKQEIGWYLTQDRSVKEIGEIAKIWKQVADKSGNINSNYGWCIWSAANTYQFKYALEELIDNQDSRRATMIYTRPSIWEDFNKDGMSDYICTWGTHAFIRNNKLYYIINQRSCDVWFGLRNDFAWHCYVYQRLYNLLIANAIKLEKSYDGIIYNCDSIHAYERHFNIITDIVDSFKHN